MNALKVSFDKLSTDVKELSLEIKNMRANMLKFEQNLENTAKKSELKEIESLLDLYNPIKSRFVTRDELDRILEKKKE
jgi:multidrug resistance efflux pump